MAASQEEARKELQEFKAKALTLLDALSSKNLPRPCGLQIFVGKADFSRLRHLLQMRKGRVFSLYIHEKASDPALAETIAAEAQTSGQAISCELDLESGLHLVKLEILVTAFNIESASLSVEASFEAENPEAVGAIDAKARRAVADFRILKNGTAIRSRAAVLNLPALKKGVAISASSSLPKDAIVCGAGPSLSLDLPAIAALKDRVLVIAVGHAVKGLMAYGITPDIAVEVETMSRRNWPSSEELFEFPLAAPVSVDPLVSAKFSKILWLADDFSGLAPLCSKVYGSYMELAQVAGVMVSAVDLAAKLGCERIALTGSDLCVSKAGASHYNEGVDSKELSVLRPVEGCDGEAVLSSDDFISIKESLESRLGSLLQAGRPVRVWNCSKGGAKILNCGRSSLEELFGGLPESSVPKSLLFEAATLDGAALQSGVLELASGMESLKSSLLKTCKIAQELKTALLSPAFDESRARKLQTKFHEASERISSCGSELSNPLAQRLFMQSSLWSSESPRSHALSKDPASILDAVAFERGLWAGLAGDLAEDAAWSSAARGSSSRDNASFDSFSKLASEIVSEGNPEFGEALLKPDFFGGVEGKFILHNSWQNLPALDRIFPDGSRKRLLGQRSMERLAQKECLEFLEGSEMPFDPAKEALLLVCPGNWVHAVELSKAVPDCQMIVADPWPELLSSLIRRSMFMHLLPKGTLVLGIHESLPSWPSLLKRRLEGLKRHGLKIKVYLPPFARTLPESQATLQRLAVEAGMPALGTLA